MTNAQLTRRERFIMTTIETIAAEQGTTESSIIAHALGLKTSTVRGHLHSIMQKAGVSDKGALLLWWRNPNNRAADTPTGDGE